MHLGSSNYLDRYKIYVSHLREWRQQFDKTRVGRFALRPADHRESGSARHGETAAAFDRGCQEAAMAAGVKPAALITHIRATPSHLPTSATNRAEPPVQSHVRQSRWSTAKTGKVGTSANYRARRVAGQAKAKPGVVQRNDQAQVLRQHRRQP